MNSGVPAEYRMNYRVPMHRDMTKVIMVQKLKLLPMTLRAMGCCMTIANPRSPILTSPVFPLTNILSHFKSR
jgi:hypothetical protein